ncbi:unnamed protein product [Symbiodinium necroappetens]|uniref:Transmembrane protein n=1 Tax=Symbiodinium necroappetens TaxID=1628268 RepID=A0A812Y9W5_9DINO|nr:unnamed protein product [Symbiodinium necroappetens]
MWKRPGKAQNGRNPPSFQNRQIGELCYFAYFRTQQIKGILNLCGLVFFAFFLSITLDARPMAEVVVWQDRDLSDQEPSDGWKKKLPVDADRTLVADPQFEFPNFDQDPAFSVHEGPAADREELFQAAVMTPVTVFRSLMNVVALPFSPLASEGLQQKQVAEIAERIHRYKDPAAAGKDEADDRATEVPEAAGRLLEIGTSPSNPVVLTPAWRPLDLDSVPGIAFNCFVEDWFQRHLSRTGEALNMWGGVFPMSGTAALDELTPHIDIEDFFANIVEATDSAGWVNVQKTFPESPDCSEHDGRICYKFSTCGSCMTRLQFVVNTPLEASSLLTRPEAFSQPIVRVSGFVRAEWLEQVGPGDAIVRISQEDGQQPLRACSMRRILESPSCLQAEAKESVDWDAYFARMVVRRDIPSPGMAAMLVLPLGRRHTALFQVGPVRAYALTAHPHTEPGKVIVSNVIFLPFATYPVWATTHLSRLDKLEKDRFEKYMQEQDLPKLHELDRSYYTILHLRNCNRGPPLLPFSPSTLPQRRLDESWVLVTDDQGIDSYWTRWNTPDFNFYLYLGEFLHRNNIQLKLYGELNGKCLVPYQVAVRTQDWSLCKDQIHSAFHNQQRAYRRLNGGVAAPRIGEAPAARFQLRAPHAKKPCFASPSTDVVVRRTFLNELEPAEAEVCECGSRQGWMPARNAVGGVLRAQDKIIYGPFLTVTLVILLRLLPPQGA